MLLRWKKITILLLMLLLVNLAIADNHFMKTIRKPILKRNIKVVITVGQQKKAFELPVFNGKSYDLAWQTYLANRQVQAAYVLAKAAVHQQPNNLEWRKRYAQAALWFNKPDIALKQWQVLQKNPKFKKEALQQIVTVAKQLQDYNILMKVYRNELKERPDDLLSWQGYIKALVELGYPDKAVKELETIHAPKLLKFKLTELAKLYRALGKHNLERKVLAEFSRLYGVELSNVLRQAEIEYIHGDLKKAYQQLLQFYPKVPANEKKYWQTFADLAWTLQDNPRAQYAYTILYQYHATSEYEVLRLILLSENTKPQLALQAAQKGYAKYKSQILVSALLRIAYDQKKWKLLADTIRHIPHKLITKLEKQPFFWETKAQLAQHQGNTDRAVSLYKTAMRKWPDNMNLKVNFLWFLIDNNQSDILKNTLSQWQALMWREPALKLPFAMAFLKLNKLHTALKLFYQLWPIERNNFRWLLDFADVLQRTNQPTMVPYLRQRALYFLGKTIGQQNTETQEQQLALAELATDFLPADITQQIMVGISQRYFNQQSNAAIMAWALSQKNDQLARYVANVSTANQIEVPDWIQLSLAIRQNDREVMQKLIYKNNNDLSYHDRILAAQRLGNYRLATTLAYQGLAKHPNDSSMYQVFQEVMLKNANRWQIAPEYRQFGVAVGPYSQNFLELWLTPRISISPYTRVWWLKSSDTENFVIPFSVDYMGGIKIKYRSPRGKTIVNIGQRKALRAFFVGSLQGLYRINSKLQFEFKSGYHVVAEESTSLLVGGYKNELKLGLNYQMSNEDFISWQMAAMQLLSQDDNYLGYGGMMQIYYSHKFQLSYPDWNINAFVMQHVFEPDGSLSPTATRLVPADQTTNVAFYVPQNSFDWGIGFGMGQGLAEEYTHAWRPYFDIGITQSTLTGLGPVVNLGVAGSVFGRDHLVLYFKYSQNQATSGESNIEAGLRYQLFFT
jgi:polysaccharide biosynthesis protein PelB